MIDVDVVRPRICARQRNRQNAVGSSSTELSPMELIEEYYRINVTIPFLDEVIVALQNRFSEGQESIFKGLYLIPAYTISLLNWDLEIEEFIQYYSDEIPNSRTVNAELGLWKLLWKERWEQKLAIIHKQHLDATGKEMKITDVELKKLKFRCLPSTVPSTFDEMNKDMFPNIVYLLSILAVLPVTTCEAERIISALRQLKTYMRSTMLQERLTGLALMNIHSDIPISIDDIVTKFATKHPRRMKLTNILEDQE